MTEGLILGKADAEPSLGRYHEALALIQGGMEIGEDLASKDASDYLSRYLLAATSVQFVTTLTDKVNSTGGCSLKEAIYSCTLHDTLNGGGPSARGDTAA